MQRKRASIEFIEVTKSYLFRHEKPTLSDFIYFHNRKNDVFTALSSISFVVNRGDRIAIIGVNGSGKTTILKLMSGVSSPTSGNVNIFGRVVSLIDLAAGFHPDLSGIDNIIINALLIGMQKTEVQKQLDKIISFADIGQFIDQPFFTYSEGMKLRLGFSVGVHSNPDIFILDENIAAGDENFKKKALLKIHELFHSGKTVVVATHLLDFIKDNFDKVIWLEKGKIKAMGGVDIVDKYIASFK